VRGLNLTWEVRDGIGGHSKGLADLTAADAEDRDRLPQTLEGQVVRLADRIAYVHHDTDDAIRAGLIAESDVPAAVRKVLGDRRGQWLGRMVTDLVEASREAAVVRLSDPVREALNLLKDFLVERVYRGPATLGEVVKARRLVTALYAHYLDHPHEMPPEYRELISAGQPPGRVVGDFLAGMTDRYAIRLTETLFVPRGWAP
jgi:dGTPase